MAPAWGPGVASVVGPVGLLVVLLVGGCAAEGKSLVRDVCASESVSARVSACVPTSSPGPQVWPRSACVAPRRRLSKVPAGCGSWEAQRPIVMMVLKAVLVMTMMMAISPALALYHGHCQVQT